MELLIGLIVNLLLGIGAYLKKSVTLNGCIAGIIMGTGIYFFGGPLFWSIMVCFFISSTVLGHLKPQRKRDAEELYEKTGPRDHIQVLANSLVAFVFSVLFYLFNDPVYIVGFVAAFASSNADTWASEIGALSRNNPVSAVTLKRVPKGTSGGVSVIGLGASLMGALFIALVFGFGYMIIDRVNHEIILMLFWVTLGGFLGSLVDSLLGATVQAQYLCPESNIITEKTIRNGKQTIHIRGFKFINNDMVNFISSLLSVLIVSFLYLVFI